MNFPGKTPGTSPFILDDDDDDGHDNDNIDDDDDDEKLRITNNEIKATIVLQFLQTLGHAGHSCSLPKEGMKWFKLFNILDMYRNSPKHSPTKRQ